MTITATEQFGHYE